MNVVDGFVGTRGQNTELVLRPDSGESDFVLMLEFQVIGLFFIVNLAPFVPSRSWDNAASGSHRVFEERFLELQHLRVNEDRGRRS